MAKIANVALTNTFDTWRTRSNQSFDRLSQFAINNSSLYANTITANNVLKATGNTVLGASGKRTIVTGLLSANGRVTVGTNLAVTGNTTIAGLIANGTLGTSNYVLRTNGTSAYWAPAGSTTQYLQVANAVSTYQTKAIERAALANTNSFIATKANATNPTTSGLLAHTGRATISTSFLVSGNTTLGAAGKTQTSTGVWSHTGNLTVSGNTSANKSTVTSSLTVSGNTTLGGSGKTVTSTGVISHTGNITVSGNTVLGGAGKSTVINGGLSANNGSARGYICTVGIKTTNFQVSFSNANFFTVNVNNNITMTNPTNQVRGQTGAFVITQGAAGSKTLSFGTNFKFASGAAPTITTTANAIDMITYYVNAANTIYCDIVQNLS